MKVTSLETIRSDEFPNMLWVQVHDRRGPHRPRRDVLRAGGGGGPYPRHHRALADRQGPAQHRGTRRRFLTGYVGFSSASAEMRGSSAIDIALWDILGQSVKLPLCDLLGGRVREKIKVYNTCAGYSYVQTKPTQGTDNFGLTAKKGQYEDLDAFLNRADELAHSLLEMDITAMKIWPLDYAAEKSSGYWIGSDDLKKGIEPFEKIRKAVGDKMDIACELHSLWSRPQAIKIAQRARATSTACGSRTRCSWTTWARSARWRGPRARPSPSARRAAGGADYRQLFDLEALSMVIMDVAWCGGVSRGARRSRPWPRPIMCRSPSTTAPGRWR